jgi:hypothetical protein
MTSYSPREVRLVSMVAYELGQAALEEAWDTFGDDTLQMADGALWMHLRDGRWASVGDHGLTVADTRDGKLRVMVVSDRKVVQLGRTMLDENGTPTPISYN